MGLGDDLMITAFAEQEKKKHPKKQIVIGNVKEKIIFDSIIFKNNPHITPIHNVKRDKPIHFINYHNRNRPYLDKKFLEDALMTSIAGISAAMKNTG